MVAVAAVALGASVATAMSAVALGVGDKVNRELRSFGANIEALPRQRALTVDAGGVQYQAASARTYVNELELPRLKEIFWAHNILEFAPFLTLEVKTTSAAGTTTETKLVGTWFDHEFHNKEGKVFRTGVGRLSPWWKVTGRLPETCDCLVGALLANKLRLSVGDSVAVAYLKSEGNLSNLQFRVSGLLETGSEEDDSLIANLDTVQRLAGLEGKFDRLELSALTSPEDAFARRDPTTFSPEEYERWSCTPYARSIAHDVERALTNVEAHPVLRISQTEGAVLSKIDLMMLLVALAALTAALLGVASTMTTTVLERKSEIGLLKAIGASNLDVTMIFLAETGLVGMIGGLAGLGLGWGLAQIVARSVFGSAIEISAVLAPMVIVVSIAVAFIGSALPLRRALRFEPSVVLRER